MQVICIKIICSDGGLKLLQIQDNGHGISKEDLPLVCERFATSKLRTYEDLRSISTFGFRGEALASISHVSLITIVSMTSAQSHAYRAIYLDGKLIPPKSNQSAEPKPVAGTVGTQITVENLFYNSLARRKALRSPNEEYQKIVDLVTRYAVHNARINFVCKKLGESEASIFTSPIATVIDNIRALYGKSIADELLPLITAEDQSYKFSFKALITHANYNVKRSIFILFINNRLVESSPIRKAIDNVYSNYLPRGTHPFVYISLQCAPENVDVNVHPTKAEVHLLNEASIIDSLQSAIHSGLLASNTSRIFYVQRPLTLQMTSQDGQSLELESMTTTRPSTSLSSKQASLPYKMSRNDPKAQTICRFLSSGSLFERNTKVDTSRISQNRPASIEKILELIEQSNHRGLEELLQNSSFVGSVNSSFCILQQGTKMYLVDYRKMSKEMFFQKILRCFSTFSEIYLDPPPSLFSLLELGISPSFIGFQ